MRLRQNRLQDALDDLRIAARLAHNWRREAFPDDATRVSTENMIQKCPFRAGGSRKQAVLQDRQPAYAQETFESAEANRAASLRAVLAEPRDWRRNLPPEYWETLQKLESAEVELLRSGEGNTGQAGERVRQLQGALIQWESRAGSDMARKSPICWSIRAAVWVRDDGVPRFHLASPDSYLWAVSRESFAVYRLPAGTEIAAGAAFFSDPSPGSAAARAAAARIFRVLFGQLHAAFRNKPRWLLALDAQLFRLPFAALVEERGAHGLVFLAERHALRIASSAGDAVAEWGVRAPWPRGHFWAWPTPFITRRIRAGKVSGPRRS